MQEDELLQDEDLMYDESEQDRNLEDTNQAVFNYTNAPILTPQD